MYRFLLVFVCMLPIGCGPTLPDVAHQTKDHEKRIDMLEKKQKTLFQRITDLETAKTGIIKIKDGEEGAPIPKIKD